MALSGQSGVSAELLRAFQAGTTTAVIDATGRLIEVSARLCEVLGRGRDDLLERSFGDLFDGASDVRLFHQSAVLDAASGWREVVALQRASGRRIFVELSVEPFPTESGEQHRLLLFNVVSRPRSAELELLRSALEDASQASAQRLQFLFEGVPTMVYSAEADGPLGVRFMSPNVKTVLGHDARDFVDASFWAAHVHPDDLQATIAHAVSLKQTKWQSLQYRFRHRDGTYRWMLDECRLVETPMQRNKVFGYWMDITARKDTELLLRDSQERLAQAQAGAELGGWQLDVVSGVIHVDEAAATLLGIAHDARAIDPDGWRQLVHADDIPAFSDPLTHHLQGESEILLVEMRMRHAQSGRWLWVRLRGRVDQRDASGRALRLSGTLVNVTKRKLAEEAALRAQGVVEAATNGMVVVDGRSTELGILYANPAFLRITGYRWEEVVGRNCRFLQGTDHEQPELSELREAIASRRSCSVTLRNYRKDGALFWNELSVSPVFDPQGHLTHWVGVLNDITTRRRLEEELRQAQKMEAFGQLAGGVAHDFNNLLTVILAGTSLLMRGHTLSAEALAEVHSIAGAAERGADLTRQLLAFSRRSVKAAESLDLGELVSNMAKLLRRVLGEDIQLESRVAPGLPPVLADRGMIDQVIMNLAVNARDAMAHGGRLQIVLDSVFLDDVEARRHPMSRPGRYVCLRVIDSGCGIPTAHLSQIFEPFFTTKAVGKGTGLGLATAYGIVLQHQGWIDVESEVDVGSTFSVYLPAVTEVVRRPRKPLAVVRGGRETILIVEDEAPVRRSAKALLEGLGYSVLEADSGDSALWVLKEHASVIALVFTDMVMPGGTSGRRLAQIVAESHPQIPVIFTSGYSPDVMAGDLAIFPGRNFLQKPYRDVELAAAVRAMLDRG